MNKDTYPFAPWLRGIYRKTTQIIVWLSFVTSIILIYHVNHHLPKGEMYATGDYACMNDGRGPCGPEYTEDIDGLDIPEWAKFLKSDNKILLLMGLPILGILLSSKKSDEDY